MSNILPTMLQEATQSFIDNLLACETFVRYHQASTRLDEDSRAHSRLEELSQVQARLRQKQSDGGVTEGEVAALRALQEEVQRDPVIMGHAKAQQEAVNMLREINTEISQLLGINFASFANRSTC